MKKVKSDGGRFLCSVGDGSSWYEITDEDARLKTTQRKCTFHEKSPCIQNSSTSHITCISSICIGLREKYV